MTDSGLVEIVYCGPYPEGQTVRLPNGSHSAAIKPGEKVQVRDVDAEQYIARGEFKKASSSKTKKKTAASSGGEV